MRQWLQKRPIQPAQELAPQKLGPSSGISNQAMLSMLESQDTPTAPRSASGGTPLGKAMQAKIERQFGLPMGDVRIHHNSDEPAKFDAGAYTYGSDIFLGPGQEDTLEHELTHVAQQKKGLVQPEKIEHGIFVNCDSELERCADEGIVSKTTVTSGSNGLGPVLQKVRVLKKHPKKTTGTRVLHKDMRAEKNLHAQAPTSIKGTNKRD